MQLHKNGAKSRYVTEKISSLDDLLTQTWETIVDAINIIQTAELNDCMNKAELALEETPSSSSFEIINGEIIHQVRFQIKHLKSWPVFLVISAPAQTGAITMSDGSLFQFIAMNADNSSTIIVTCNNKKVTSYWFYTVYHGVYYYNADL